MNLNGSVPPPLILETLQKHCHCGTCCHLYMQVAMGWESKGLCSMLTRKLYSTFTLELRLCSSLNTGNICKHVFLSLAYSKQIFTTGLCHILHITHLILPGAYIIHEFAGGVVNYFGTNYNLPYFSWEQMKIRAGKRSITF